MIKFANFALLFLCFFLSGCALFGGGGEDYLVRGEIGYFNINPEGDFGLSTTGSTAITANNDLSNLGLDDDEVTLYPKITARLGANELALSGFQADFSGSGTVVGNFGDIPGSTNVNSSMDITNLKLTYRWYVVDYDFLSVGPGLGIDFFDIDAEVNAPSINQTEDISATAPVPVLGLSGVGRLDPFRAFVDANYFAVDVGDLDGTFLDLEGGIRFQPLPLTDIYVGYRLISLDASGDDDNQSFDINYELPGLFFGIGIRF